MSDLTVVGKERRAATLSDVVDALQDLTRVTMSLSGVQLTKSDMVRRLSDLGVPTGRITALMGMASGDVASTIAKAKRKAVTVDGKKDKAGAGEASDGSV